MNSQHVAVATAVLSGKRPNEIAEALSISAEELAAIRKSKAYRRLEATLADRLLDDAGNRLVSLANEGLDKIQRVIRAHLRNLRGDIGKERRPIDVHLAKEIRLSTATLFDLALKISAKREDKALEAELKKQFSDDEEDD